MPDRTPTVPHLQLQRLTSLQHRTLQLENLFLDLQLGFRKEVLLTGTRAEKVGSDGLAECYWFVGRGGGMHAEDDHVRKIFFLYQRFPWAGWGLVCRWFFAQGLTEDAAIGEDGEYRADYVGGGGEGDVPRVVLYSIC